MRTATFISTMLAATMFVGAGTAQPQAGSAAPLTWLAGCWSQDKAPKWTEECWMAPRGGVMLGAGRSGTGVQLREWEATQILPGPDGKLVYWASPDGGTRVAFTEVSRGAQEIVFANPAHDYPQRIRYWRSGAMLNAEISLADGSKAMRWQYKRDR